MEQRSSSSTADWIDQEISRLRFELELDARMRASGHEKSMLFIRWFCYATLAQIVVIEATKIVA